MSGLSGPQPPIRIYMLIYIREILGAAHRGDSIDLGSGRHRLSKKLVFHVCFSHPHFVAVLRGSGESFGLRFGTLCIVEVWAVFFALLVHLFLHQLENFGARPGGNPTADAHWLCKSLSNSP